MGRLVLKIPHMKFVLFIHLTLETSEMDREHEFLYL